MNAERCACCGRGVRKKTRGGPRVKDVRRGEEDRGNEEERLRYPRSPEVGPVPSFRCPRVCHAVRLNAKGPRSGSGATERAGKGKIRRQPVAKRKIGLHISSRPATTTTTTTAAAAAPTTRTTTTTVEHIHREPRIPCVPVLPSGLPTGYR